MEDAIASARSELAKVKPTDPLSVEAVKKADVSLDEGSKALATWLKHIKIADHSDLSWATVNHYMADPFADSPEDEKEIARSENEAHKDLERALKKEKKGGEGATHQIQTICWPSSRVWSMREVQGITSLQQWCPSGPVGLKC